MTIDEVITKIENDDLDLPEEPEVSPLTAEEEVSHVAQLESDLKAANERIAQLESDMASHLDEYKTKVLAILNTMTSGVAEETKEEIVEETEEPDNGLTAEEVQDILKEGM